MSMIQKLTSMLGFTSAVQPTRALFLMIAVLLTGACMRNDAAIPKEGDVVTWMQNSALIIRAELGQRREHIPRKIDDLIYEPEYEMFIGQFPIAYVPERFPKFTEAERVAFEAEYAKKLHGVKDMHDIEFSLMLNGAKEKATDQVGTRSELDDINQVKVQIKGADPNYTTKGRREYFIKSKNGRYDKKLSEAYGIDCYTLNGDSFGRFLCYGESSNKAVSGVFFARHADGGVAGEFWEPIYGGIHVEWHTHIQNLKHWREIDAAIWRLLETWNISPLVSPNQQ
ncbi:MAG: hypothetical protein PSV17_02680 [Methylotenera sp.]|uniref:hypothetical protein n=1 Tax=Methylotenera sp. TaxID=2051956 RepID=UPI002487B6B4|nr:hypothetical protein [Methylotenera sp.]MDI1308325.1 hypothetical protein [Methylotenera sp.]